MTHLQRAILALLLATMLSACAGYQGQPEPVTFVSRDGIELSGSLVLPEGISDPVPAVVLLHGAEPATRGKVYRMHANIFLERGMAVLLYDKRGTGKSGGDHENATYAQLIEDALAAVDRLRQREEVDGARIGLVGASQSGWLTPEIAERAGQIAFVINKVSPCNSARETMAWEVYHDLLAEGVSEASAREQTDVIRRIWDHSIAPSPEKGAALESVLRDWTSREDSRLPVELEPLPAPFDQNIAYDPAPFLERITTPMLYVYGSEDVDVPTARCVDRLTELRDAGLPVSFHVFQGAGHELGGVGLTGFRFVDGYSDLLGNFAVEQLGDGPSLDERLIDLLQTSVASRDSLRGVALHVESPQLGIAWRGAGGYADPSSGEPMTSDHPVRIASNTKTYIAAAVLRLWEDERLDLDDPIAGHLPGPFVELLVDDGYRPDRMTVRHLLTHTSGLDDHGTDRYVDMILADPQHRWSRAEQLRICVEDGQPRGEPGEVYLYSDTGYVLLGEILERTTGQPLADAVWGLIDRDRLGLTATWFESLEPRPQGVVERAHQFYGDLDVSGFDPSFDLWGGGGIATTVGDLARFTRALFSGGVYRESATLQTMLSTFEGLRPADHATDKSLPPGAYRMGVWVLERDGYTLYRHTGFWCTSATYVPQVDLVVTATANQHEASELLDSMVEQVLELVLGVAPTPRSTRG